jgi:hypothetical protein
MAIGLRETLSAIATKPFENNSKADGYLAAVSQVKSSAPKYFFGAVAEAFDYNEPMSIF